MQHRIPIFFLGILILTGAFTACRTQPVTAVKTGQIRTVEDKIITTDSLDAFIRQAMDDTGVPGLSIAIINDAGIVYHRTFGVTNLNSGLRVTDSTLFEAASLSKPLFAYFVMKMVEKGVLDLDAPIYPSIAHIMPPEAIDSASFDAYQLITPRMILCHATGMPNWAEGKPIHIAFPPGTGFSYSGEAYQHLGAALGTLLEVGWQSRLDSVFQKEVAEPLGLRNSFFTWNEHIEGHKASGHRQGKPTDAMEHGKAFGPGYSLHTEAYDYALFLTEMMKEKHLDKNLLAEMLLEQNKFTPDNELLKYGQTGWGLGFARRPTEHGLRYMHTGNNHDFQSYACFYKEGGYGLVLFINADTIEPFYELLGTYLGDKF
ncbi:MAG: serine hydrolase domain-containing protein [Saprospiraceae bacterium]|nr:beta-lactamase family protein [Lewinella sp.]